MATDVDVTPLLHQPFYERSELNDVESPPLSPDLTQPVPRALAGLYSRDRNTVCVQCMYMSCSQLREL